MYSVILYVFLTITFLSSSYSSVVSYSNTFLVSLYLQSLLHIVSIGFTKVFVKLISLFNSSLEFLSFSRLSTKNIGTPKNIFS